jgi:uncharacterized protein YodC (DUF2158 family)
MDFKPGDIVTLKSGGPKMTIERIYPRSSSNPEVIALCTWFDGAKSEHIEFYPEALKAVQTE